MTKDNVLTVEIPTRLFVAMGLSPERLQDRLQAHLDAMTPEDRAAIALELLGLSARRWEAN